MWIVNPNGVVFGQGAQVNVGGLLASSADISDKAFMNSTGAYHFDIAGNDTATIRNSGTITVSDAGLAALVAPNVRNDGTITATLGSVQLGSSKTYTVDMMGDGLVSFAADDLKTSGLPAGALAAIENEGKINAAGGRIGLSANVASTLVGNAINLNGTLDTSATHNAGTIAINASNRKVSVGGKIKADSAEKKGGTVSVVGNAIDLLANSLLSVRGALGGGTVNVGKSPATVTGSTATQPSFAVNAASGLNTNAVITMASGAKIDASATQAGNGGTIGIVGKTNLAGDISAVGMGAGNSGGRGIVISSDPLSYSANANMFGAVGAKNGTLSLITSANQLISTNGDGAIMNSKISNSLSVGNVQITGASVTQGIYTANLNWGDAGSLYLQATQTDVVQTHLSGLAPKITATGPGAVWIDAARDVNLDAGLIQTNTGNISIRAGNNLNVGFGNITSTSGNIDIDAKAISAANVFNGPSGRISAVNGTTTAKIGASLDNAINAIRTNNGATILLKDGTYTGNFNVDASKDNLAIGGINGPANAKINGGFYVSGDNVTIDKVGINSNNGVGAAFINTIGGAVQNSTINGAAGGILARNTLGFTATGNTVTNTGGTAIGLTDSDFAEVSNNTITNAATGVDLINGSGTINNNTISDTTGIAIALRNGTQSSLVEDNTITNSKNGIILNGAVDNYIIGNTLTTINGDGIAAFNTGAGGVRILANTIDHLNNGTGIALNTASNSLINGNTVTNINGTIGQNGAGISIANSAGTKITNNWLDTTAGNAIEVIASNNAKVNHNRIFRAGQQPIVVVSSSNVDTSNNDIH